MKSLQRKFQKLKNKYPMWSTYLCFAETVREKNFSPRVIKYWFNLLVEKGDYEQNLKKQILRYLVSISKTVEARIKKTLISL